MYNFAASQSKPLAPKLAKPEKGQARVTFRFHLLKPEYVHHRIKELQRSFRLRLLICHIDVEDVTEPLGQVIRAALLNEVTLICGWSPQVPPSSFNGSISV